MGIISDAIDALEDWCKDLFKDGIQSQFDGISDLLTDTFSQTTGTGGSGGQACLSVIKRGEKNLIRKNGGDQE